MEVQKGDPEGPPPILTVGDDDIYWVSKLHDGLQTAGFYPADEEVRDWASDVRLAPWSAKYEEPKVQTFVGSNTSMQDYLLGVKAV